MTYLCMLAMWFAYGVFGGGYRYIQPLVRFKLPHEDWGSGQCKKKAPYRLGMDMGLMWKCYL